MRDPFSYSARWDSVGLDCAFCVHQSEVDWPNVKRDYSCLLHNISLAKELGGNGFKEGEWFCSSFTNDGSAYPKSIEEFSQVKEQLSPNILYGAYGDNKKLKEIPFVEL